MKFLGSKYGAIFVDHWSHWCRPATTPGILDSWLGETIHPGARGHFEMALTILRTAYSGVLKDNMDYSTAFCDAEGRTVAQGLTLPGHLSSFPDALAAVIRRYGDRMRPGDVFALNDPKWQFSPFTVAVSFHSSKLSSGHSGTSNVNSTGVSCVPNNTKT